MVLLCVLAGLPMQKLLYIQVAGWPPWTLAGECIAVMLREALNKCYICWRSKMSISSTQQVKSAGIQVEVAGRLGTHLENAPSDIVRTTPSDTHTGCTLHVTRTFKLRAALLPQCCVLPAC